MIVSAEATVKAARKRKKPSVAVSAKRSCSCVRVKKKKPTTRKPVSLYILLVRPTVVTVNVFSVILLYFMFLHFILYCGQL